MILTDLPIWETRNNCFSLITGSYCWMTGIYASLIPHPPWLVGSILFFLFLVPFINSILKMTGMDIKTLLLYETPIPFTFEARKNSGAKGRYFPEIIIIRDALHM